MGNHICGVETARIGGGYNGSTSGTSISDDGLTIAFGSYGSTPTFASVYTWNGSAWALKGDVITQPTTSFSSWSITLALSGDGINIVCGAGSDRCAVFKWSGSAWVVEGNYGIWWNGTSMGVAISEDGSVIAFGNEANGNGNSGGIRVYDRDPSSTNSNNYGWTQRTQINLPSVYWNYGGRNVFLSHDGNIVGTTSFAASQTNLWKYNSSDNTWTVIPFDDNMPSTAKLPQLALSKFGTHVVIQDNISDKIQVHEIDAGYTYEQVPGFVQVGHMAVGCDTATAKANNYKLDISGTMDICGNLFSSGDISANNIYIGEGPGTTVLGYDIENSANLNSSTMVSTRKEYYDPNATEQNNFYVPVNTSHTRFSAEVNTETITNTTNILGSTYNCTIVLTTTNPGYMRTKHISTSSSSDAQGYIEQLFNSYVSFYARVTGGTGDRTFNIDFFMSTTDTNAIPFQLTIPSLNQNQTNSGVVDYKPTQIQYYNDWPTKVGCRCYWSLPNQGANSRTRGPGNFKIIPKSMNVEYSPLSMNNIGNRYAAGYPFTPGIWEATATVDTSVQNQYGCVKIYDDTQNNGTWTESAVIHGDTHLGEFGRYVGLSGDGKTVLVSKAGASNNQTIYLYK